VAGAGGRGGGAKIIMGVALIAIAIAAPYAIAAVGGAAMPATLGAALGTAIPGTFGLATFQGLAMMGAMMALGGIVQLLSPQPKTNYDGREGANENSFIYGGPTNTSEQGGPVPLIYGTMIVGAHTIVRGVRPEDMPLDAADSTAPTQDDFFGIEERPA